jgi:multisubunit Na+/H+ antiporter MnhC subunit
MIQARARAKRRRCYDAATKEPMPRTFLLVAIAIAVVLVAVAVFVAYRMFRRDPPQSYEAKGLHPSFRSHRGRGR